jgi:predicted dehydrogenase
MIRMAPSYAASIAAFVDFAAARRDGVPGIEDGFEALVLAEAATRSLETGVHCDVDTIYTEIVSTAAYGG